MTSEKQPETENSRREAPIWKPTDRAPVFWNVGDLILNRYIVTQKLGEGGMGVVYKVHDRQLHTDLAVKSPRPEMFAKASGKEDFIREAETWIKLRRHPHVAQCFFVQMVGGLPRLFTEYVDGGSLADYIKERTLYEGGEKTVLARMLDLAIQMAWGLHAAHIQGLVHQDVKPANVLLTSYGTAKVTDFGIAKARADAGEAALKRPEGEQPLLVSWAGMTPAYCSPEQAARQPLSRQSDIWSWGLSVLHMFVGKVTWMVGAVAREALATHAGVDPVIPLMPPRLVQLLSRCFEPLPEQRPATMLEVATELQAIYAHTLGYAYSRTYPPLADLETGELIVQGIALDILGKSQEALALYEQAEHLDPEDATAHHNRGLALLQLGRFEEALAAYVQAIHLYEAASSEGKRFAPAEDISLAYEQKGLVLRRLGRAEEALVAYEQALSLNPVGTAFHNNRGNVLLDLGRKAEALDAYEQAIRLDQTDAIAHLNRGNVLLQLKKRQEAEIAFAQARTLDPTLAAMIDEVVYAVAQQELSEQAAVYLNASVDLLEQGKAEQALGSLEKAIELDPTMAEAYLDKGVALKRIGRLEEALASYEQALQLNPKLVLAYNNKGNVLLELGRPEEALSALILAVDLDPRSVLAQNNMGNALLQLQRPEEALFSLEKAINLDPTFAAAHMNRGRALLLLGKGEEALAAFTQATALDPTLARTISPIVQAYKQTSPSVTTDYEHLGHTCLAQGKVVEALAAFEQALRYKPTLAAYCSKALALLRLHRPAEALEACEQALRLDPTFAVAHLTRATTLVDLGRLEEALGACEQALRFDPTYAIAYHRKALILARLSRVEETLAAFDEALRIDPTLAWVYYDKARALAEIGRQAEALDAFDEAVRLDPSFAQYWRTMLR